MSKTISYLLKIQNKLDYQEALVKKGNLHMNCAKYYRDSYDEKDKQGDCLENSLRKSSAGINLYSPMFCLYAVFENDVVEKRITLPIDLLKSLNCKKAYITLLNYTQFKNKVEDYCKKKKIGVKSGLVVYGKPSDDFVKKNYNLDNLYKFMFIKSTKYNDQQEYRFVFDDICGRVEKQEQIDGMEISVVNSTKAQDYYIGNLQKISKIFEIDIPQFTDYVVLDV